MTDEAGVIRAAVPVVPEARRARVELSAAVTVAGVAIVAAVVVALRVANGGVEPEGRNWWLATELLLGLAYLPIGVVLAPGRDRRLVGVCFAVVGAGALLDALATQYVGYVASESSTAPWLPGLAALTPWAWLVASTVLIVLVPFALPRTGAPHRLLSAAAAATGLVAIAVLTVEHVTAPWPWPQTANPVALSAGAARALDVTGDVARWGVSGAATVALGVVAAGWWADRRTSDDVLPLWLLAGSAAAWLAVVPLGAAFVNAHLPGRDVLVPVLLLTTVPLVVVGVLIDVARERTSRFEEASHRFLEWVLFGAGIVLVYTVLVAGLGRLVGGNGPTWLLVAATGAIALAVEPVRRRTRALVDSVMFGSRDDPLALVRQVMRHVGSTHDGDDLLPALARGLAESMRFELVAIDVVTPRGSERWAMFGRETAHREEIPLVHRDEVVGRLVVGWNGRPSLRRRDAAALAELAAPVGLAVTWVHLVAELRRSGAAVVSAREEERRRLRRDLHDGLGPALTGISLGLRSTIRRLERTGEASGDLATPAGLLCLADELDGTVGEVKRIVRDLRPSALDQLGLVGAVETFARGFDQVLDVRLDLPRGDDRLPAAVEVATYRIVTEALTNVVRHARASTCEIRVTVGDVVAIDIIDDGIGFRPGARRGVGLSAMRERAGELGGSCVIEPNDPHGIHVKVRLPHAVPVP